MSKSKIYKGAANFGLSLGTPIATIDGNKIYKGNSTYGSPLAHTDGDKSAALAGAAFLSFFS